jgi:hypothetical protein
MFTSTLDVDVILYSVPSPAPAKLFVAFTMSPGSISPKSIVVFATSQDTCVVNVKLNIVE